MQKGLQCIEDTAMSKKVYTVQRTEQCQKRFTLYRGQSSVKKGLHCIEDRAMSKKGLHCIEDRAMSKKGLHCIEDTAMSMYQDVQVM